jgi:hypothetical protein
MAISRRRRNSALFVMVSLAGLALVPGCGGDPPTPEVGTEQFEAQRKDYHEARRKEYGRPSIEPPTKGGRAAK